MKLYYFLPLSIALFSCNDAISPPELNQSEVTTNTIETPFEEIISIADSVLGLSRSSESDYSISFITNNLVANSRSAGEADTVGYILNRADNNGFVLVGNATNSKPVLAYSESGNFSYTESDDDIVYANFVSKIPDFIDDSDNGDIVFQPDTTVYKIALEDPWENETSIYPKLHVNLGQGSPFDKYIIQENPGSPVGCVAVATAAIMSHTKRYLTGYHGENFNLLNIISAYSPWTTGTLTSIKLSSSFTKDEANDQFAKLLKYIGEDEYMTYSPGVSVTNPIHAFNLFKQLGFDVYETNLTNYNITGIAWSLMDGYLVFTSGGDANSSGTHAWVIDGCTWKNVEFKIGNSVISSDSRDGGKRLITDIYLHCNWGDDGKDNGYFNGDVFTHSNYKLQNMKYFSVKREYSLNDLDNIIW